MWAMRSIKGPDFSCFVCKQVVTHLKCPGCQFWFERGGAVFVIKSMSRVFANNDTKKQLAKPNAFCFTQSSD